MEVTLNGNSQSITDFCTLNDLVFELELEGKYAVEINQIIIPRSKYASTKIQPGDSIEIVQAIGGG